MEQIILRSLQNYQLLDSGNGQKLERFGSYLLSRPDPNALWNKSHPQTEWKKADASFLVNKKNEKKNTPTTHWENKRVQEPWLFAFEDLLLQLKLSPFKHTGLFPEQIENWKWFGELLDKRKNPNILNLFGYTGGASLYAALHGATVTHVDASKPAMIWAHENQEASHLIHAPIRWITDDAVAFAQREVRRGNKYDAIILDPPAFGRSPKGKIFSFEKDMHTLLAAIQQLLSPSPLFVLLNSYATGYSAQAIENLTQEYIRGNHTFGELYIRESNAAGRLLPCSQFVRVTF